jgi:hypothetical protein
MKIDSEQFDELARAVGERGEDGSEDREQFAALQRLITAQGSRRAALAGLFGAALLGLGSDPASAGERPRQRLQGRTPRRNRKQRNRKQRNHQNEKAPRSSPWERNRSGPSKCIQDKLFGVCSQSPFYEPEQDTRPCCNGMECTATAGVLVTACQFYCTTDADCKNQFPGKALACKVDALVCPVRALKGERCCVPR